MISELIKAGGALARRTNTQAFQQHGGGGDGDGDVGPSVRQADPHVPAEGAGRVLPQLPVPVLPSRPERSLQNSPPVQPCSSAGGREEDGDRDGRGRG